MEGTRPAIWLAYVRYFADQMTRALVSLHDKRCSVTHSKNPGVKFDLERGHWGQTPLMSWSTMTRTSVNLTKNIWPGAGSIWPHYSNLQISDQISGHFWPGTEYSPNRPFSPGHADAFFFFFFIVRPVRFAVCPVNLSWLLCAVKFQINWGMVRVKISVNSNSYWRKKITNFKQRVYRHTFPASVEFGALRSKNPLGSTSWPQTNTKVDSRTQFSQTHSIRCIINILSAVSLVDMNQLRVHTHCWKLIECS